MPGDDNISPIQSDIAKAQRAAQAAAMNKYMINQEASREGFTEWAELDVFNPFAMARRFQDIETRTRRKGREEELDKTEKDKKIIEIRRLEAISQQYQQENEELQAAQLLLLKGRIKEGDTREEILKKVLASYPDFSLADEALDFLIETSEGELAQKIRQAKEDLNIRFGRETRAGRNIGPQARAFAQAGLDNASGLRDMYRDITGNPRDASTLFAELSTKYSFEKMKSVIEFLLQSLGNDLRSKGPSISRAELHRLMTDTRSMQAILGVYRFFKSRMRLIHSAFERALLMTPVRLNFELLARLFMKYLQDRYPSAEKVLQLAMQMGISEELVAQVIIYTQMRDAVRQVAPKLFKAEQHRQDVLMSFMEALEELDEQLEEGEEEDEEEKEDKEE
jgi:type III secretion protein W